VKQESQSVTAGILVVQGGDEVKKTGKSTASSTGPAL
jgi:hypothetical protein